jgi:hypothetical protein
MADLAVDNGLKGRKKKFPTEKWKKSQAKRPNPN